MGIHAARHAGAAEVMVTRAIGRAVPGPFVAPAIGMLDVVSPRALGYSGTCHQWFTIGARASRTLPTTCVIMWSVA